MATANVPYRVYYTKIEKFLTKFYAGLSCYRDKFPPDQLAILPETIAHHLRQRRTRLLALCSHEDLIASYDRCFRFSGSDDTGRAVLKRAVPPFILSLNIVELLCASHILPVLAPSVTRSISWPSQQLRPSIFLPSGVGNVSCMPQSLASDVSVPASPTTSPEYSPPPIRTPSSSRLQDERAPYTGGAMTLPHRQDGLLFPDESPDDESTYNLFPEELNLRKSTPQEFATIITKVLRE
ncbi:hypothetical protein T440DRAFT_474929 [Plenodomus tracheiphilus IPT5]|uniref:Uncharacterized protein n=1 Tax=Plenodomus tracheiphilus IPT5 TaxID=1408161 RepID=A0A6A7BJ63_9PLEO|nr:hypothetical protein T440DRAFT_474929 [Plenodomus tracheiphilus IPT5]